MTTNQMLTALCGSKNQLTKNIANRIINAETTVTDELARNHGAFLTAVLKGNYETAMRLADSDNKDALTEKRFTETTILDICFPDYFSGYHMPTIAVPVYHNMTYADLAAGIKSEINSTWEMLVCEDESECDGNSEYHFTEQEMKLFDAFCDKLMLAPTEVFYTSADGPTDRDEDDSECQYAYISLCKPVFSNGIHFLNA
jgi:hypothetical protein